MNTKPMTQKTGNPTEGIEKVDTTDRTCPKCEGKGWYFVDEYFAGIQGRKDCSCKPTLKRPIPESESYMNDEAYQQMIKHDPETLDTIGFSDYSLGFYDAKKIYQHTPQPTTIEVTGCGDCPMCDDYLMNCRAAYERDNRIEVDNNHKPITPVWCPLIINCVKIKLSE